MAGLKFDITGDNSNVLSALQGVQNGVRQTRMVAEESGQSIEQMFSRVQAAATAALGAFSAKEFGSEVLDVRGQFQQLEVAFTTMLGSASEASRLMDQLVKTAATTPFDLQGIAQGAKQLLAYGTSADEVNEILVRLGDIAAGLSIPLGDLVYLYGTTMTQGRMFTQDLRQFQSRGIDMTGELSKQFGIAKDKVGEFVTAGKVGADAVKQAIVSMTSEGGRFAGLMEKQSHTITGQISNIEDAIDTMFNEIGKKNEGVINAGLSGISHLVENWETVGKVVLEVAVAYGTYKAALLAVYAAHKAQAIFESVSAFVSLSKSVHSAKDAMLLFNMATKANPIGLIISIIASAAAAFYLFSKNVDAATKAQESLSKIEEEAAAKTAEEKTKIDLLVAAAKNDKLSMDERKEAIKKLNDLIPDYNAQLDVTTGKYIENKAALDRYLQSLARKYELEGAKEKLAEIGRKKANALLKKDDAERKQKVASAARNITYNNAGAFIPTPIVGSKEVGDQTKKINEANKELKEALEEEKLILDKYGVDLQKDAIGVLPKPKSAKSEKSIKDQIKEAQDELDMLTYKEAAGRKGAELRKKIRGLQEKAKVYSPSYEKEALKKSNKLLEKGAVDRESVIKSQRAWDEQINKEHQEAINAMAEASIAKISDENEREREEHELQHQKNLQQIQEQADEMKKAIYARNEEVWSQNNKNKKIKYTDTEAGKAGWHGLSLSEDGKRKIAAQIEIENTRYDREKKMRQDQEARDLNDYFKQYGTYEEKRLAISKEYAEKISKAENEGKRKALAKQEQKEYANLDIEELKNNINWEYVFGNLDNIDVATAEVVKEQLEQFLNLSKNLSPEQIKTVTDALVQLQDKMDLSKPLESIKEARKEYAAAKIEYDKYKANLDTAKANGDAAGQKEAVNGMTKASQKMTKAKNKEGKSFRAVAKQVQDYAKALQEAGGIVGGVAGECIGLAASAISAGASMVDGVQQFGKAVSAMEKSIAILAIIEAALQAIQAIVSIFGGTADETLTEYVSTMDTYIKLLDEDIKSLNDSMGDAKNTMRDTISYYEKLVALEKTAATAIKSQSQVWLNSGASEGFLGIGSKASEGRKIVEQMKKSLSSGNAEVRKFYRDGFDSLNEYFEKVNGRLARRVKDFGRMDWIWKLSDKDLSALAENKNAMALLGDKLSSAVKEYAEKTKSVTDAINEEFAALLDVPYDDFYSGFTDMISEMDNDSQHFANNFAEYMRKALIKDMVASQFKERLANLYKLAGKYAKNGELDKHAGELRDEYAKMAAAAQEQARVIDSITGYIEDVSQSASANGMSSISFEQANNITALTTAGNISRDQIKDLVTMIVSNMSSISALSSSSNTTLVEIKNLMITNNSHLEDILKCSKSMYKDFSAKIDDVNKNLRELK